MLMYQTQDEKLTGTTLTFHLTIWDKQGKQAQTVVVLDKDISVTASPMTLVAIKQKVVQIIQADARAMASVAIDQLVRGV